MSEELKPCPWCNGEAYAFPVLDRNGEHDGFSVLCFGCDASIETYASKEKAIFAWNTRPIEDALRAKVAYLESALNDAETDVHKALSAFNELDAQWESVPWEAINNALYLAEEYAKYHLAQSFGDDTDYDAELRAVDEWVRSNAPTKEPAK